MYTKEKLHTSKYIIYVPYPQKKKFILIHGYTGAVDLVESDVVEYLGGLRYGKINTNSFLSDLRLDTIEHLKKRGYLTTKTPKEEKAYLCHIAGTMHRWQQAAKPVFFLCPSYKCQLRCEYCYGAWYNKDSDYIEKSMTPDIVNSAFEAIRKIQPDPKKVGSITLIGGEPLLAENRDIITYILEQCRLNGLSDIRVVTNGVEIDKYMDLLGTGLGKIGVLQITIDGTRDVHDQRRFGVKGEGTFRIITKNVSKVLEIGGKVMIRTNVDEANLPFIDQLAKYYHEKGWSKNSNFRASCAIVFSTDPQKPGLAISILRVANYIKHKQKEHPHIKFMNIYSSVERTFQTLLEKGPINTFRGGFCGANHNMYLFDAIGDIYVCVEAMGNTLVRVGTYYPNLEYFEKIFQYFRDRTIVNIQECSECPWALLCGGGCMQRAKVTNDDYYSNFCAEYPELFLIMVPDIYEQWLYHRQNSGMKVEDLVQHDEVC